FVQFELTKNCTHPRDPAVTLHCNTGTFFRFRDHRSELVNRKQCPPPAHPFLSKENRTRRTNGDDQPDENHKWEKKHQPKGCADEVKEPLAIREAPRILFQRLVRARPGIKSSGNGMQFYCIARSIETLFHAACRTRLQRNGGWVH